MQVGVDVRCLQDTRRTGVGEIAWQTLQTLSRRAGLKLTGFANAAGRVDLPPGLGQRVQVVRTHVPNKVKNLALFLKLGQPIDALLERAAGKPLDALWLPNPSFAYVARAPTVLTVHDLSFMHFPEFFSRRGHLWYFPAVRRLLARGLPPRSQVAAVSQHTADDVAEHFPQLKNKLHVIYPGIGQEYFEAPSATEQQGVRERLKLPERFLLSVGTIEPRKNYQLLLTVYDQLVRQNPHYPYDLVIAGGWGWLSQPLRKLYRSLAARDRVHFVGYVSEADKRALYAQAELFLYPSFYEGVGIPALEAMASGVPVITSHASSLPEVVGEAGVLLSPYNPTVWVQTLQWLQGDSAARREFAAAGRARARQFSWEQAADQYYGLFREVAAHI